MSTETIQEARRQIEICNACRYCEGYCAVFPAITRQRAFADGDVSQLANLCHNCRGCYYACQYTEPHEFALNLPAILSEARRESWNRHAWPAAFAGLFQRSGVAVAAALVGGLALLFAALQALRPQSGEGFYADLSHAAMVAIFAPAFLAPLVSLAVSLRRYWREVGGERVRSRHLARALHAAATQENLSGGQGQGCNFEEEDRFTNRRRWMHQAVMYGFLLCFAATCAGTVMHYGLDLPAPYGPLSPPKLLGVPGGVLMVVGTIGLLWLKLRADRALDDGSAWGGEVAFILLLLFTAISGLALYAVGGGGLLAIHLGAVLALFLITPFSKMSHGFYRLAALTREAQEAEARR
jgi:citrate/tricarballylate utilization protein